MYSIFTPKLSALALHLGVEAGDPLWHTQHQRIAALPAWLPAGTKLRLSGRTDRDCAVVLLSENSCSHGDNRLTRGSISARAARGNRQCNKYGMLDCPALRARHCVRLLAFLNYLCSVKETTRTHKTLKRDCSGTQSTIGYRSATYNDAVCTSRARILKVAFYMTRCAGG